MCHSIIMIDESGEAPKVAPDPTNSSESSPGIPMKGPAPHWTPEQASEFEQSLIDAGVVTREGLDKARADEEMIKRGETPPEHILPDTAPSLERLESVLRAHGFKDPEYLADLPAEERRFRMYKLSTGFFNDEILENELGIPKNPPEPSK